MLTPFTAASAYEAALKHGYYIPNRIEYHNLSV